MTKKHFTAVAAKISTIADDVARRTAALALCDIFQDLNPKFDRARFLAACNVTE